MDTGEEFMKSFLKSFLPFATCLFVLLLAPMPCFSGLIEPTRTLDGKGKQIGYLSVYSEPPEMAVYLDGKQIGATPLSAHAVSAGEHLLRVGEVEKELFVLPGKALRYSLHKGRFIRLPDKKDPLPTDKPDEKSQKDLETPAQDPPDEKSIPPPNYFPLNPMGPIY